MKNAFYFTLKAFSVLKMFKFLSWIFGHAEKQFDKKDKFNFKIHQGSLQTLTIKLTINWKGNT